MNSISLSGLGLPLPQSILFECHQEFLAGYFGEREYNELALWFLRASGLVAVALEVMSRRMRQPIVSMYLRHSFTRLFNTLIIQAPI
jgi:hypothetical protein